MTLFRFKGSAPGFNIFGAILLLVAPGAVHHGFDAQKTQSPVFHDSAGPFPHAVFHMHVPVQREHDRIKIIQFQRAQGRLLDKMSGELGMKGKKAFCCRALFYEGGRAALPGDRNLGDLYPVFQDPEHSFLCQ